MAQDVTMRGIKFLGYLLSLILAFSSTSYAKTYVIGVDQINPPMSTRTDNADHFIGFEIDIMDEICSRLKMDCTYQAVRANQIITNLELKKIDFAIDSIIIPKFRLYGLILSLPYLPSYAQFMTLKSSSINKIEDITGKTIGVRLGAFQVNIDSDMYIKHMFKETPKIKSYFTMSELLAALEEQEVDIIFANRYATNYWNNANQGLYKFIGDAGFMGNGYGIMSTNDYRSIMASINTTIMAMMDDGSYDKIYQRYFASFQ
jgi:ABC-type amino acid transport substrate-binding protein